MSSTAGNWTRVLLLVAVGKAAVAGAGLGLAALGAVDVAFASPLVQAWDSWQVDSLVNEFALGGSVVGALYQTVKIIFFTR